MDSFSTWVQDSMEPNRGSAEGPSFKKKPNFKGLYRENKSWKDNSTYKTEESESSSSNNGMSVGPSPSVHSQDVLDREIQGLKEVAIGPRHVLVSISDQEEGMVHLPLQGPIQLPMSICKRGQSTGNDLVEVPLQVELNGSAVKKPQVTKSNQRKRSQREMDIHTGPSVKILRRKKGRDSSKPFWNLEEKLTKIFEKGTTLGYVFNSRHRESELEEQVKKIGDHNGTNCKGINSNK
ncbi:hypothetical protein QYF36_008086 [Acer negundo]|nr:hypothetical protein QYF36_008086 [Acer negundo]